MHFDIPLALQPKQSLTYRRAADVHAQRHFVFAKAVARQQLKIKNIVLELQVDALRQPLRPRLVAVIGDLHRIPLCGCSLPRPDD
ncbi:hypothetical protein D3C78_1498460 [compost metagenome]